MTRADIADVLSDVASSLHAVICLVEESRTNEARKIAQNLMEEVTSKRLEILLEVEE